MLTLASLTALSTSKLIRESIAVAGAGDAADG